MVLKNPLRHTADIRRDDREPGRHRFQIHDGESLREGGAYKEIERDEDLQQILPMPEKVNPLLNTKFLRKMDQFAFRVTFPCDNEMGIIPFFKQNVGRS